MSGARRSIRPATADEYARLRALQSVLPDPSPATLDAVLAGVGTVLVSERDGQPVGYVSAIPGGDTGWLSELVVAPDARRDGRGRALLTAACARLESDHDRVRLAVLADNAAARSLYESEGFETVGRSTDYFEEGTAVVYERPL